ncbi:hypothetical protein AvCA_27290 [Azotobacter vinelandii CA]|uniref:Uncharacterized protein n=2 Tax=Azotobacter vinelandii TaxID=354 RepID=C1DKQ1_AZOVD|nr:hypothetical protein Avin_27290 [Azotobacter vinelandii DJ]AGK14863.1 hypothetical protein AvCA_27290 [Azotobacter vinelandii CA]AGK20841.1 hypothetical protein AvCA6_27290 [Azotobacter vinelandii CA6]
MDRLQVAGIFVFITTKTAIFNKKLSQKDNI